MGDGQTQGHHNAYFSSSGPVTDMIYSPDDAASDTLDELWRLLEENLPDDTEAIAPPHALLQPSCGSGSNWTNFDESTLNRRYRPLAEVYSHWGSSEMDKPAQGCFGSAREALVYGNRIGFYGSSDTHFAYPGNPQTEAWGTRGQDAVGGLAAVHADALTREALWQGLTQRRTYAAEGERIFLDFTVDGYLMRSEISPRSDQRLLHHHPLRHTRRAGNLVRRHRHGLRRQCVLLRARDAGRRQARLVEPRMGGLWQPDLPAGCDA